MLKVSRQECAVHWKFLGGRVVLKAKILEATYEAKLECHWGGGGGENKKHSVGGRDILWKCTLRSQNAKK